MRAVQELKTLLRQLSSIKLREVDLQSQGCEHKIDILAHIDVLGHSYLLTCGLIADGTPHQVRKGLDELHRKIGHFREKTIPVVIVPHLSQEVQALCGERNTGYLDMEGNARLVVGEVFIFKRSLPCPTLDALPMALAEAADMGGAVGSVEKGFAPARAELELGSLSRTVQSSC